MPITINTPIPGGPIGPGVFISGQTDLIGPLPSDAHWHLDVLGGTTNETVLVGWDVPLSSQDQHLFQMTVGTTTNVINSQLPFQATGTQVHLRAQLVRGIFDPVVDSGQTNAIWDPVGLAWTVPSSGTVQGGFTDQDRLVLQSVEAGIQFRVPAVGAVGGFVGKFLGDLVQAVPGNWVSRHGSVLISGDGSFQRGTEPYRIDGLGLTYDLFTVPAGYGFRGGPVNEYERRLVQWHLVQQDDSGQGYSAGAVDENVEGQRVIWGLHQPTEIQYRVAPGVVLEVSFLVFVAG